jgi:hypothetical protein
MPTSGRKKLPEKKEPAKKRPEKKYQTEKLLKSRHLAGYQRDFAKVILTGPAYSIPEAKALLDRVLKGG